MKRKMALVILSVAAVATAHAHDGKPLEKNSTPLKVNRDVVSVTAPEIDPASAISAFTLLAGGLMMIRGRRANKNR